MIDVILAELTVAVGVLLELDISDETSFFTNSFDDVYYISFVALASFFPECCVRVRRVLQTVRGNISFVFWNPVSVFILVCLLQNDTQKQFVFLGIMSDVIFHQVEDHFRFLQDPGKS